ncbi:RNA polymerase-binding protein DksA [Venenivibrio stagnispumantis]|uniref:Transcriptional regulator, TraR/DksA family n=1 Tax=Venenivibrio stagnispumantis TaxID=407998 RepID=A0AA46ADX1_9AQUI|nr:RNA polymerase-binding protein DksA [Venenivibrio stagnispumantis]MCW4572553.1 RNA polymerase-binding protein DksA [Venenivibrio stagnispumantis]SMP09557.1 transcriptional regulator, TraR/DksA family [Venenivibrio stagnispumantis]
MKHLTPEQIEELRNILIEWKNKLLEGTRQSVGETMSYQGGDEIDRADLEADRLLTLRNLDRDRKLLKKIEYTLTKIENGTYGICESCGAEIPYKRLKARPVASLCINCKEKQEEEEE